MDKIVLSSLAHNFLTPCTYKRLSTRSFCTNTPKPAQTSTTFNVSMLDHIACPLTKSKLRYDEKNQELICDELSVAYPIVNGIPVLTPYRGRILNQTNQQEQGS
jgi:uncharacterized protein YbaR (Trm112 family)